MSSTKNFGVATRRGLYQVAHFLDKNVKRDLGVFLEDVYAYLQDPLIAKVNPQQGISKLEIMWEPGLDDGPTSSRFVVVDYNADTGELIPPTKWRPRKYVFRAPNDSTPLDAKKSNSYHFHQVNVWAIAQSILDMYQDPKALGRPIPWATGGNRLILVPHAGYGENAYYDRHSKSLQFYYFGDPKNPKYTCLSHDIIAHETGHAVLDGIRPYYYQFTSLQTAAFHEAIADLTAILGAILNNQLRGSIAGTTTGDLTVDNAIALIAQEFGQAVIHKSSLRNTNNKLTMEKVAGDSSPHYCSQVLTGAMFEILAGIGEIHRKSFDKTPKQALWWAADRFRRIALQPLDYCPPVDVQFLDYARAVLTHYQLHEPIGSPRRQAYFELMNRVFHERKICPCKGMRECLLEPNSTPRIKIFHDVHRIARSRTAVYSFLNDNRAQFHIPSKVDLEIADLYDIEKLGRPGLRLPREIVLQYIWREEVPFTEERFGRFEGERTELLCGGTVVLDERNNILAWSHKPGTEYRKDKKDQLTGTKRIENLKDHFARQKHFAFRGEEDVAEIPGPWAPSAIAERQNGVLHLEIPPHLRNPIHAGEVQDNYEGEEVKWTSNF